MLVVFQLPNSQTNINTYTWLLGEHDRWNVYTNTVYCVQTTGMGVIQIPCTVYRLLVIQIPCTVYRLLVCGCYIQSYSIVRTCELLERSLPEIIVLLILL